MRALLALGVISICLGGMLDAAQAKSKCPKRCFESQLFDLEWR